MKPPILVLTLPRFLFARALIILKQNPAGHGLKYAEQIQIEKGVKIFLWCNASLLFAQKHAWRPFAFWWCQYILGA